MPGLLGASARAAALPTRPPAQAAPAAQSQRDGGSHGAGARQPSPGRCRHPSSDAEDDFLEPATPTAAGGAHYLCCRRRYLDRGGWGAREGPQNEEPVSAELTLGCRQARRWRVGVGRRRRQCSLLPYPPRSHHPPSPPPLVKRTQVCLPCPQEALALPILLLQDSLPPVWYSHPFVPPLSTVGGRAEAMGRDPWSPKR